MPAENSIIDVSFDDLGESKTYEDGKECLLEIVYAAVNPTKDGSKVGLNVVFVDPDDDDVEEIRWWCELPTAARMEEDKRGGRRSLKQLKEFYTAFSVSTDGPVETDSLKGSTGYVILGLEESVEYGEQNKVKKFVIGR